VDIIQPSWLLVANCDCRLAWKHVQKNDVLLVLEIESYFEAAVPWRRNVVLLHDGRKIEAILTNIKSLIRNGKISILQIPEDHGTMEP
jgi:hypothetical protein